MLTPPGRHPAVLLAYAANDLAKNDEICRDERGGRDNRRRDPAQSGEHSHPWEREKEESYCMMNGSLRYTFWLDHSLALQPRISPRPATHAVGRSHHSREWVAWVVCMTRDIDQNAHYWGSLRAEDSPVDTANSATNRIQIHSVGT